MAIKPTDIVIYLKDEQYLADAVDWYGQPTKEYRYPRYWENFEKYIQSQIDDRHKLFWDKYVIMQSKARKAELAKYNIEYKDAKDGPYLKFKSEADITFFKLKWT